MDPETVVENLQTSASQEAVAAVTPAVSAVAGEVAQVGEILEEHAELSEERHEEILEGEAWTRNQLELLLTNSQTQLTVMNAIQSAVTGEFQALRTLIESMGSRPQLPSVAPEPIPVVEPIGAVVVVPPVVETEPEIPKRRRRVI